ncbi:MAG: nucleotidyl transferase AbiEii/AbiGii toxin family protein [Myxococcota bacterium]
MNDDLALVAHDLGQVAVAVGTRVLLVGAYARDLCLGAVEPTARMTNDADFAVLLESWAAVDAFFAACAGSFRDVDRGELKMYHRATGLKVDLVPCGPIEVPPGTLSLRGSRRRLNTVGLVECFALGRPLGATQVVVPPPAGFVVLKLLAFTDRREPRDLRDLGYVLHRIPFDPEWIWEDDELLAAFSDGSLTYDDARFWYAGREIRRQFAAETVAAVLVALRQLRGDRPDLRVLTVESLDPDERLTRADRMLAVLDRAVCGGPA